MVSLKDKLAVGFEGAGGVGVREEGDIFADLSDILEPINFVGRDG